jgi:hypothetical protein
MVGSNTFVGFQNICTLFEKVLFFSFGFRSSTEKVSKMFLFQVQIMIVPEKRTFFSQKEHF